MFGNSAVPVNLYVLYPYFDVVFVPEYVMFNRNEPLSSIISLR
jgi:hypothetical protein